MISCIILRKYTRYPRISVVKGKVLVEVLKKLSDTSPLFKAEVNLGGYIVFPVKVKSKYE